MFYRLLLVFFSVTVIAHCGKPHPPKLVKRPSTVASPEYRQEQRSPDWQDAA